MKFSDRTIKAAAAAIANARGGRRGAPPERAALVRMVSASADLIIEIGRAIAGDVLVDDGAIDAASENFVAAIIGVQESEEEAVRESYR